MDTVLADELSEGVENAKRDLPRRAVPDPAVVDIHDRNQLGAGARQEALVRVEKVESRQALFACGDLELPRQLSGPSPA